jgi:hypothetical protein
MKKLYLLIAILLIIFTAGYLLQKYHNNNLSPKELIENYFIAANEKDISKLNLTVTEHNRRSNKYLDSLEYVKLNKIIEDEPHAKNYLTSGRGKIIRPLQAKSFRVYCEYKFKTGSIEEDPTQGQGYLYFNLIKQNKNSSWLISDIGF